MIGPRTRAASRSTLLGVALACSATPVEPVAVQAAGGDAVAVADPPSAVPIEPASVATAAVSTPQTQAAHAAALGHVLPDGSDPFSAVVEPRPWRFVPIEPGASLDRFATALDEADRVPVRIAMYGASGTAADTHTAYVRAYLQHRFGDGGPGLVPLGLAKAWSRHAEVSIRASKGWQAVHAVRHGDASVLALGPAGLAFDARRGGAWVELRSRSDRSAQVRHLELFALAQPGGGTLRVRVDGGKATEHPTAAPGVALLRVGFDVEPGAHRLRVELAGDGPVRLFGVAFERGHGVVVDTLGVDGARARNWQRWDPEVWRDAVTARPPSLVTIAYGTNEAVDLDRPMSAFAADFTEVLRRIREAAPQADCVVLGPGDFPERTPDGFVPRPRLAEIIAVERELALAHGCGFWDELAFMGGPGSMTRWVGTAPPLAREDHLHFRPAGAAVKGHLLVDALVLGHDAREPTAPR